MLGGNQMGRVIKTGKTGKTGYVTLFLHGEVSEYCCTTCLACLVKGFYEY